MGELIIDLYAGPGGWDEGARLAGLTGRIVGWEWDPAACATAEAAGHERRREDVSATDPATVAAELGPVIGGLASPPCTTLSLAGHGGGRLAMDTLIAAMNDTGRGADNRAERRLQVEALLYKWATEGQPAWPDGKRAEWAIRQAAISLQVVEPLRWFLVLRPVWMCWEQVPAAMPLWKVAVRHLRAAGYSAWAGVLNAADFGVPQTRRRAVLMARLDGPATPPEPTHARHPQPTLFGELLPWVSMAQALGWGMTERPMFTLPSTTADGGGGPHDGGSGARRQMAAERDSGRWQVNRRTNSGDGHGGTYPSPPVGDDRPSPAVTGQSRMWVVQTRGEPTAKHPDASVDDPAPSVTGRARSWVLRGNTQKRASVRSIDEPAGTMFFGHHANKVEWVAQRLGHKDREGGEESVRISVEEATALQSFPPGYPWQGSRTKQFEQIGNAVPPLLAAHVIAAARGQQLTFDPTGG